MRRFSLTPTAYRRITVLALAALLMIVVTGAAVRLTGSGLGCSSWPNCEPGRLVPHGDAGYHGMIEFVNRLFTGVVSLSVAAAVLGSLWREPRRRDLTWWSWTLVAGVLAQIVLGGLTVLFELAPPFVIGHFLLSAVLVACATVLHHKAAEPDRGERRPVATPEIRLLTRALVVAAGLVLVTGTVVTGSGPHGGDENVERLPFFVPDVVRIHAIAVWLLVAGTVWTYFLVRKGGASPVVERALRWLIVAEIAQGAVGYTQYFTGVPVGLVALHVFGSMVVWVVALRTLLRTTVVEATTSAPRRPAAAAST